MNRYDPIQTTENVIDWDKDPFIKYQDLFKDTIDWAKDPMSHPTNQNKYFYSDGKTYYEQICKMLKLMSAFKESFAYIYENEEELHSAWENFVDNLSATAQSGEEAGVTLTWTEDSVNFDFTIPGGEDGVGIQSIVFNADYSMTITLTDGTEYESPSLRGPQGETGATGAQGPQGPQGEGLEILDVYATLSDLQTAHPTGSAGDAYQVGTSPNFTLYIWSTSQSAWVPAGALTSPEASVSTPLMDGTASVGSETAYARGDHRHPTDTSRASQSDLTTVSEDLAELAGDVSDLADGLGAVQTEIEDLSDIVQVSQSLIDQEFLYRETPADHDTIGRLDSIKGNTIKFNQLANCDASTSTINDVVFTNNGNGTWTVNGTASAPANKTLTTSLISFKPNHKYYFTSGQSNASGETQRCEIRSADGSMVYFIWGDNVIYTISGSEIIGNIHIRIGSGYNANNLKYTINIIDLTDAGIDSFTTPAQVEAWLLAKLGPLDYFGYDPGSLISFKGTGLKTTGKNLCKSFTNLNNTAQYAVSVRCKTYFRPNTTYAISFVGRSGDILYCNELIFTNANWFTCTGNRQTLIRTTRSEIPASQYDESLGGWILFKNGSALPATVQITELQIELGETASDYEAYSENTLSLPVIAEKFPDGEMSAGTAYDVLSKNDYDKVIGIVDLGNLVWTYQSTYQYFYTTLSNGVYFNDNNSENIKCVIYSTGTAVTTTSEMANVDDKTIRTRKNNNNSQVYVKDLSYTDATTFANAVKGQYLYYELKTPLHNYGVVDLGSLEWTYYSGSQIFESNVLTGASYPQTETEIGHMVCSKYIVGTRRNIWTDGMNNIIAINPNDFSERGKLWVRDTSYNNATTFKTAMSGVYLLYEKTTPEVIDLDLTYPIEQGGTEQLLPVNTSTPVTTPLLADMSYMSTDEAIKYLYENGSANVESEISALDSRLDSAEDDIDAIEGDITTINTAIGSESTTPMTGILGRLNEAESDISFLEKKIVWQNPKESGWMDSFAETHIDLTDAGVENYRFLEVIGIVNSGGPHAVTTGPIALDFSYSDHTGYGTLFEMGVSGLANNYIYHSRDISYFNSTKKLNIYDCYAHENGVAGYVTNGYLIPVLAIVYN